MAEKKSRRVYAGYYNRYDGKLIYVARVVTDIDTGEEIVICQYANYSDTGEYYTITKASFCEQVEWNGQMVNKYSRRTQQKIDYGRIAVQTENGLPEPKQRKPKRQRDEYDNRGYRRSRTYYAYAKDLCEHYLLYRIHQPQPYEAERQPFSQTSFSCGIFGGAYYRPQPIHGADAADPGGISLLR